MRCRENGLDVTNLRDEIIELLLRRGVLLRHLLVLGLPLVALVLEGLHFALEVACFDVGLAESASYTHNVSKLRK